MAARELHPEGHTVTVFEQNAQVGGVWVLDDNVEDDPLGMMEGRRAVHSSMYDALRVNLPRELMGFSDFPFVPEVMQVRNACVLEHFQFTCAAPYACLPRAGTPLKLLSQLALRRSSQWRRRPQRSLLLVLCGSARTCRRLLVPNCKADGDASCLMRPKRIRCRGARRTAGAFQGTKKCCATCKRSQTALICTNTCAQMLR